MGVEHFNAGRFFQAHECWETAWHMAPEADRDFWQGITQIAVGFTHHGRGNLNGAMTLLERGIARASTYGEMHHDLEVGAFVEVARRTLEALRRSGLEAVPPNPRVAMRPR